MSERTEFDSETRLSIEATENQRRQLELELVKIRSEARAARLDARAAEIEMMLRALGTADDDARDANLDSEPSDHLISSILRELPICTGRDAAIGDGQFADWDQLRAVMPPMPEPSGKVSSRGKIESLHDSEHEHEVEVEDKDKDDVEVEQKLGCERDVESEPSRERERVRERDSSAGVSTDDVPQQPAVIVAVGSRKTPVAVDDGDVAIEADSQETDDSRDSRRKPAAWLVSLVAHVAVLLILGAITLQAHRPRDQVALAASPTEANEVSMETFTIESAEPENEESETTPSEAEYEMSPVGELAAVDFAPEAPLAPPSPAMASPPSQAAMSLKSDSTAKIQFCGVEGGGNHFVYLVDSSGSMGDAFESARSELIGSIEQLKAEQRFYVVFFDADSEYMRLSDAGLDEPRSVYATEANKAALRRWAMRISMDRGKAPYDPLRFALRLKPDVVFLLSDGEFPQGIEDLLKEENKVENLFGDRHPICIVHTIGYHSKEGESRMRRIAQQNQGQYRHIPRP